MTECIGFWQLLALLGVLALVLPIDAYLIAKLASYGVLMGRKRFDDLHGPKASVRSVPLTEGDRSHGSHP